MSLPDSPFKILEPLYSSQSATSCYMECPRRYLFQYRLYGTGIVPKYSSVPLVTGNCIHKAVENIAEQHLAYKPVGQEESVNIDKAVAIAQEEYRTIVSKSPLGSAHSEADEQEQQYIVAEQMALTEALIRLWYLKEWPKIIEFYDILAVEQEITFELGGIIYQSKPDLILLHKKNGDVINYSLKSIKYASERLEKQYKVQLQAITEPYATSLWLKELTEQLNGAKGLLNGSTVIPNMSFMSRALTTIKKSLEKYSNLPTRSSATRFCYLIKGDRKETKRGNGRYRTANPFIYGLRKFTPNGIEYAWSWFYPKPENDSGWGRLGKGWEQFPIWEDGEVGGIKGWMQMLLDGSITADIGDGNVFDKHVLAYPEVYSNEQLIEDRIEQIEQTEKEIAVGLDALYHWEKEGATEQVKRFMAKFFPMNTGSCFFPSQCDYLSICPNGNDYYKQHIADDPISEEFGKFERRISHHEPERIAIENV